MLLNDLASKTITFSLADEDDAEFIYKLRIDESYNKHLSEFKGNISTQKEWLKKYKIREGQGGEYYFIIKRKSDRVNIGTVRIYDFIYERKSFCWGSWILNGDKTKSSAIETALLVYKAGFEVLKCTQSHFDVRKENSKVIAFHKKLGAVITAESELDFYFEYQLADYLLLKEKYKNYI